MSTTTSHSEIPSLERLPKELLQSPELLGSLLVVLSLIILLLSPSKKKALLARARWADKKIVKRAMTTALKQIKAQKHNEIAAYVGTPKGMGLVKCEEKQVLYIPPDPKVVWLPNLQGGIFVVAGPESGKSYTVHDPVARSWIDQGKALLIYDYKGYEQTESSLSPSSKLAGYASDRGYKVYLIAAGSEESDCLNLVDFINHPNDADNAYQLGNTLIENFGMASKGDNNSYFSENGSLLLQAIFMLAKTDPNADLPLCQNILALEKLHERIQNANLSEYQRAAFANYLKSAKSPETAGSIESTAGIMLSRFMTPEALSVFARPTTIPLDLHGRVMVIFRLDARKEATMAPLYASAIHMLCDRNVFSPRQNSFCALIDEASTILLPKLPNHINLGRSNGASFMVLVQSLGLLEAKYGKERVEGILGGCKTQICLAVSDNRTAEYFSHNLGKENICFQQKSNSSGKGGSSTSSSEQQQTRALQEPQQLMQLLKGEMILRNPGYTDDKEDRLPYKVRVRIPKRDQQAIAKSCKTWTLLQAKKIRNHKSYLLTDDELKQRRLRAETMLPIPQDLMQLEMEAKY